ncbi:uncharacterized protein [Blastocystis hominis]|uniref:Uncharacterized protein n=1 Tax=Blastocystis hominis TaxID=12968 RepID=D8M0I7_BLAHO|nr:uncharacterized protein [Blastocystis hominis]CBK21576.2 unnamed protein product [Blastocystis hominis]|eukprot:XP_012895624.1 uncharacterized protein [Blastocystis hominis]
MISLSLSKLLLCCRMIFPKTIHQSNRATLHTTLTWSIIKERFFAMPLVFVVLLLTVFQCISATCVSLGGVCYGSKQNSMQFNINWLGKPNYEDVVYSMFNGNQCDSIRYSFLHHNDLKCQKTAVKGDWSCVSTTSSVWVKGFDMSDYVVQHMVNNCHRNIAKKYVNIAKLSCVIDGVDIFAEERANVGKVEYRNITVTSDHFPVYEGYYPERYECVWNYEVNGIWSTFVIMVVTCSVIVIILFIAIFIYAQKHRAEKRASLLHAYNKKLIETVTK